MHLDGRRIATGVIVCQKEKRSMYRGSKDRQEKAWKSDGSSHRSQVGDDQEKDSILGDPNRQVRQEEMQVPAAGNSPVPPRGRKRGAALLLKPGNLGTGVLLKDSQRSRRASAAKYSIRFWQKVARMS